VLGLALAAGPVPAARGQADSRVVDGLANVRSDGTLSVGGTAVRLFGIYLPLYERTCRFVIRPPSCAPKAVLVLEDRIKGFVRCELVRRGADGILEGICGQRTRDLFGPREDLGAYLVQEGFALASPYAPPEYFALERLAESRELGLWGNKFLNFR
jgi:endonuclease YncB( thermonuclease family)